MMHKLLNLVSMALFVLFAAALAGCDECTLYCEEVADCIEQDIDDWAADTGWDDRATFIEDCAGDYPPGPGMSRVCRIARMAYTCNEGDWSY